MPRHYLRKHYWMQSLRQLKVSVRSVGWPQNATEMANVHSFQPIGMWNLSSSFHYELSRWLSDRRWNQTSNLKTSHLAPGSVFLMFYRQNDWGEEKKNDWISQVSSYWYSTGCASLQPEPCIVQCLVPPLFNFNFGTYSFCYGKPCGADPPGKIWKLPTRYK